MYALSQVEFDLDWQFGAAQFAFLKYVVCRDVFHVARSTQGYGLHRAFAQHTQSPPLDSQCVFNPRIGLSLASSHHRQRYDTSIHIRSSLEPSSTNVSQLIFCLVCYPLSCLQYPEYRVIARVGERRLRWRLHHRIGGKIRRGIATRVELRGRRRREMRIRLNSTQTAQAGCKGRVAGIL